MKPALTRNDAAAGASVHPAGRRENVTSTRDGMQAVVARLAPYALGIACLLYIAVIFLASKWQLDALRMGFDPLVYEQPLWNTLHGHIAEQSALSYTTSAFGQDLFLFHFVLVPFFALKPTTATLLFLQTVAAAGGAVAVYCIARDVIPRQPIVPLLFSLLFLSYLPMQNVNLYEVQPRLFAATFLLFAFWFMMHGRAVAFWVMIVLALINRNDVALVIAALGVYGVVTRRRFTYSWAPIIVGLPYWLVAVFIVIPAFAHGAQFSYLQNYDWLGGSFEAIVRTVVTHPVSVARTVAGQDRWEYVVSLLFALGFLPLLSPRVLLIAVPPFLLNIFAGPHFQYQRDIFHQYSAFITPWLFIAAIFAVGALMDGTHPLLRRIRRGEPTTHLRTQRGVLAVALVCGMLCLSVVQQAYTRPNKVGDFVVHKEDANRIASVDTLIPMIPQDAPLSVTSLAATRVPLRRYLYEFPGNSFYDATLIDRADYVLGDRRRDGGAEAGDLDTLKANGQWQLVKRQGDFELLRRITPPPPRR